MNINEDHDRGTCTNPGLSNTAAPKFVAKFVPWKGCPEVNQGRGHQGCPLRR